MDSEDKRALLKACINGLEQFLIDRDLSANYATEETLRYLVALELSKIKNRPFGSIPNRFKTKPRLLFEFQVQKFKSKTEIFKPDIVSIIYGKEDAEIPKRSIFAIELKIKSSAGDIKKCANYLSKRFGFYQFEVAVVVDLNSDWRFAEQQYKVANLRNGNLLWVTTSESNKVVYRWWSA